MKNYNHNNGNGQRGKIATFIDNNLLILDTNRKPSILFGISRDKVIQYALSIGVTVKNVENLVRQVMSEYRKDSEVTKNDIIWL